MENAPTIILFWFSIIAIVILIVVSLVMAIVLFKKNAEQYCQKMQFAAKICLTLSILCSIPIFLVIGYILYLRIG